MRRETNCPNGLGGVTAFFRSPAVDLWKESDEDLHRDEVVLFEIMASELDEDWWRVYRLGLQQKFHQEDSDLGLKSYKTVTGLPAKRKK